MPLKPGPNGTFRMYSSVDGRYCKMSFEQLELLKKSKKVKPTKEERRIRRTKYLRDKALYSKDPGLYEVFDFLEKRIPHYVQYVNQSLYIPSDQRCHETDIIGKNAIIEIKMGRKGKVIKQLILQKEVADRRHLKMIVYAPNLPYNARQEIKRRGIIAVRNKEELFQEIKK